MNGTHILAICILALVGCTPSADNAKVNNDSAGSSRNHSTRLLLNAENESRPVRIINQFGMSFRLIEVDSARAGHQDSFPKKSYYLQETELSGEQHSAFRRSAFGDGRYETINWYHNGGFPSEWREVVRYVKALSKFDTEYDYRLPSRSQWTFACMSGYEQRCDKTKPNAFGIVDMLDGDCEVVDELTLWNGHEFGVLMGRWKDNWGEHRGKIPPECPCEHWTFCNPDADDSLNELIVGRLVLLPEGTGR